MRRRVGVLTPTSATHLGVASPGDSGLGLAGVPAGLYALVLRMGEAVETRRVVVAE